MSDSTKPDTAKRKETHQKNRARLRKKLLAQGVPPDRVTAILANKAERQHQQRIEERGAVAERERVEEETYKRLSLDDSKHRPTSVDPLLRGAARATGETARAVRRGSTVAKWQYRDGASPAKGGNATLD